MCIKKALNHGLKIEKVHSVISFSQSVWLKQYIDRHSEFRMKANNDLEKDYFKLLNNSFYGKTMENVRKHRDIRLVNNENRRSKIASEPNYNGTKYISEDFLIIQLKKHDVYMNKPLYLRQAILDYSKMLMYEFWYGYLQPKYNDKIELCYMDTDRFIIYVETDDFYSDFSNGVNKSFDTSNYSKDINRPLEKGKNKKVIGKFKDELSGLIMNEFCALRAKTYTFKLDNNHEVKKAKCTKKCVIENQLTFKNYINTLFNKVPMIKSQFGFRSRNYEIYTKKINKIALSSNDNKRIQDDNGVNTYPHGYFDNNNNKKVDTKSELDILMEEAKALRNKSEILREEANNIKNNSKTIRKEINDIIKESHTIKENNTVKKELNTKSELDILREEVKALRNNSKILRKEANTIQNNSKILRKEVNSIIKESHAIKENNTKSDLDRFFFLNRLIRISNFSLSF